MLQIHTYQYRRRLPHFQKFDRAVFVTFCKLTRDPFPEQARDLVLKHCIYEHRKRIELHAAVIMPDHVRTYCLRLCKMRTVGRILCIKS
jgi:hypothetical protein